MVTTLEIFSEYIPEHKTTDIIHDIRNNKAASH